MESRDVAEQQGNMAEAAVENPAARFFCHRCTLEIRPVLPEYLCPHCDSGFIEEVIQHSTEPNEESDEDAYNSSNAAADTVNQVSDLWSMLSYMRRQDGEPGSFIQSQFPGGSSQDGREGTYMSRPGPSRRIRYGRNSNRRSNLDTDTVRSRREGLEDNYRSVEFLLPLGQYISTQGPSRRFRYNRPFNLVSGNTRNRTDRFLQQLVTTLSENTGLVTNATFPVFLNLHSNPGDYAWGRGGWNAIITQLINQLDGTGPPPLPKEKIDEIPTVNISQEQVEKNLQCTVCMEDFQQGEPVRRLTCDHHFHDGCIIPWLELHGTCPICRKLLNDGSSQENVFSSSPNMIQSDMIELPGLQTQQLSAHNADTDADGLSRRNDSYNPHQPSVYDFTEEFD